MARRARRDGSVFWGCSRYPTCRYTTSREPLGPVHDADGAPLGRVDDDAALCLACGATVPARGRVHRAGPPDRRRDAEPGRSRGRPARGRPAGAAKAVAGSDRPRRTRALAGQGGAPGVNGEDALERFLASLAARDASPHTRRAYATAVAAYLGLARRAPGSTGGRPIERRCGRTLPSSSEGHARTTVAQRLAAIRSFHRWARRTGLAATRPVGGSRHRRAGRAGCRPSSRSSEVERLLDAAAAEPVASERPGR